MAVKQCASYCVHEYQDRKYGKGRRVMNRTKQSAAPREQRWRCTICGKEV